MEEPREKSTPNICPNPSKASSSKNFMIPSLSSLGTDPRVRNCHPNQPKAEEREKFTLKFGVRVNILF